MATANELVPFVQSAQIKEMDKQIFELEKQIYSLKHSNGSQESSNEPGNMGMYGNYIYCSFFMYICMYLCMYVCVAPSINL